MYLGKSDRCCPQKFACLKMKFHQEREVSVSVHNSVQIHAIEFVDFTKKAFYIPDETLLLLKIFIHLCF